MKKYLKNINYGIKKFCKNVIKELEPKCVILYGSLARGDFNERSDIDIIVISSKIIKESKVIRLIFQANYQDL